ncbi:MAG: hypothetical protein ACFHX7_25030 [Pseudomonadota bacterium]
MDSVKHGSCRLTLALLLGLTMAGSAAADSVTVHTAPAGRFFVKLVCEVGGCEAIGYRATREDTNHELWRVATPGPGRIVLSDDGEAFVSEFGTELTVYVSGQFVGTLPAAPQTASIRRTRTGVELLATDGTTRRFEPAQPVEVTPPETPAASPAPAEPDQVGPRQVGPREVGPREVGPRQVGPRQVGPRQAQPQQTESVPIRVESTSTIDPGPPKQGSVSPVQVIQTGPQPVLPAVVHECEVTAVLRSGRRVSLVQQGPSPEVAMDRAQAMCEGMVGAGSRSPAGTCEQQGCQELETQPVD